MRKENFLDISLQHFFPFHFIALGVALLALSILLAFIEPWAFPFSLIFGLLMVSTHYRLRIDGKERYYQHYLTILGFKLGNKLSYREAKSLYINRHRQSNNYGFVSRVNTSEEVYQGFLKFDEQSPISLGQHKNVEKILPRIRKVRDLLGIEIRENYDR